MGPLHGLDVPSDSEFRAQRQEWQRGFAQDIELHQDLVSVHVALDKHRYGYHFDWLGVPIIRTPDDILIFQELVFAVRPHLILEIGVARGGGAVLAGSLLELLGRGLVLGIDIDIREHTHAAIAASPVSERIELWQGDSTSEQTLEIIRHRIHEFAHGLPVVATLDSNHTHAHVLAELRSLVPLLPGGSFVVVADTIIERLPADYFPDRPWGPGNSPESALQEFLSESDLAVRSETWGRRAAISESRDSIIEVMSR